MVDVLLDTSIVVDLLRSYQPAQDWAAHQQLVVGVTKFVWLEVVQGASNKTDQERAIKLLNSFDLVPIEVEDVDWALRTLTAVTLANNRIDVVDALVAAPSHRLQLPLLTRNLKHMTVLLDSLAQAPYN